MFRRMKSQVELSCRLRSAHKTRFSGADASCRKVLTTPLYYDGSLRDTKSGYETLSHIYEVYGNYFNKLRHSTRSLGWANSSCFYLFSAGFSDQPLWAERVSYLSSNGFRSIRVYTFLYLCIEYYLYIDALAAHRYCNKENTKCIDRCSSVCRLTRQGSCLG